MSPLYLSIALWYHVKSEEDFPQKDAPAAYSAIRHMIEVQLLTPSFRDHYSFMAGPALPAYIEALCSVPFPERQETWIIPEKSDG